MGTSFVKFIDKGYWTHDLYLEGLSYLLAREFQKGKDKQEWQIDLVEKWNDAATIGFVGCVPSYLDRFDTHEKVQLPITYGNVFFFFKRARHIEKPSNGMKVLVLPALQQTNSRVVK